MSLLSVDLSHPQLSTGFSHLQGTRQSENGARTQEGKDPGRFRHLHSPQRRIMPSSGHSHSTGSNCWSLFSFSSHLLSASQHRVGTRLGIHLHDATSSAKQCCGIGNMIRPISQMEKLRLKDSKCSLHKTPHRPVCLQRPLNYVSFKNFL